MPLSSSLSFILPSNSFCRLDVYGMGRDLSSQVRAVQFLDPLRHYSGVIRYDSVQNEDLKVGIFTTKVLKVRQLFLVMLRLSVRPDSGLISGSFDS